jgi:hypothetical protein
MSVDRAYSELLKDKKRGKSNVGIVDSGVDIEHEDLKSVIGPTQKKLQVTVMMTITVTLMLQLELSWRYH